MTVGVTKAGSAWKVVSASSSLSGDETLAGKASPAPTEACRRAAEQRRADPLAGADPRACRARSAPAPGCEGLHASTGARRRPAALRQVAFPTVSHGYIPAFETLGRSTPRRPADRLPLVRRRAQRRGPRPREPRRQRGDAAECRRPPHDDDVQRHAAAAGRRLRHPEGPVHGRPPRDGVRAIDVFANADNRRQRHRPQALPRHDEVMPGAGDTGRRPSASATRRRAASRPATTSSRSASSPDSSAPVEPRTYTGHDQLRHERRARAVHSRAGRASRPTRR